MLAGWRAKLKSYFCGLQSAVMKMKDEIESLTASKMERDAQRRMEDKGSMVRLGTVEQAEEVISGLSHPILSILDASTEPVTEEMVRQQMRLVEPTGAVVVLTPSGLGGGAIEAEKALAACVSSGAFRFSMHLAFPGAHATAAILLSHSTFQDAREASGMLSQLLACPGVANGVSWLPRLDFNFLVSLNVNLEVSRDAKPPKQELQMILGYSPWFSTGFQHFFCP